MEQYWNSMWKNYTASMSRNSNGADFAADNTDGTESFINNDLHYKIPFWIGVIVISLLFVSAIIASIRYCYYMICSAAHRETEKVSLVPPRSPFLRVNGVASHTLPRQQRPLNNGFICDSSIDEHSSSSSSTPEKCEGQTIANISNIPIIRPQLRPNFNATHTLPRHHKLDMEFEDSYFPSMETARTHISHEFRKKIQGVYVLPVSPALSSSSSTTNTDDMIKSGCSTMPIRSMRHISSSNNVQKDSSSNGVKNDCFTDSPLPKDRTLPRSHANTLRRVQAPAQPPPLPPVPSQMHSNTFRSFVEPKSNQMLFERRSTNVDVDPSEITLTFNNQTIYNTHREHPTKKPPPPPVPCRSQKPSVLPIGFETFTTEMNDHIGFQSMIESTSMQDDFSEHWPKPPDSMMTPDMIGPPPVLPPSVPYDRLNHEHLIPTVLLRQNSKSGFFHSHHLDDRHMFSESET